MDNPKNQLIDKLKTANYVLVTVSHDPSIDQLAALIGLTLTLNKAGKHAAAVFSGQVPSTLEFLKPEDTIEKTTDSLRDFIIALDKSKADKLRYKVEDDVVRIFITPYKTSITAEDLDFSQGDFNVDVVVALGVTRQEDLDEAIVSHGRILHDATVATVNISEQGDLGSIHWQDGQASSLSEMMTEMAQQLGPDLIDNQIATALLTGIVAETERFSNEKTSAKVMSASAVLMAAGANQQLVASELAQPAGTDSPEPAQPSDSPDQPQENPDEDLNISHESERQAEEVTPPAPDEEADQPLEINHDDDKPAEDDFQLPEVPAEPAAEVPSEPEPSIESVFHVDEQPAFEPMSRGSKLITEPPSLGGQLTANAQVAPLEPSTDPLSLPATPGQDSLLSRGEPVALASDTTSELSPELVSEPAPQPPAGPTQTLAELEAAARQTPPALDAARDEVMKALNSDVDQPLEPVQALNAQPMVDSLHTAPSPQFTPFEPSAPPQPLNDLPGAIPVLPLPDASAPAQPFDPAAFGIASQPGAPIPGAPQVIDPNAAPPVPPPIPFNFGTPPTPPQA